MRCHPPGFDNLLEVLNILPGMTHPSTSSTFGRCLHQREGFFQQNHQQEERQRHKEICSFLLQGRVCKNSITSSGCKSRKAKSPSSCTRIFGFPKSEAVALQGQIAKTWNDHLATRLNVSDMEPMAPAQQRRIEAPSVRDCNKSSLGPRPSHFKSL